MKKDSTTLFVKRVPYTNNTKSNKSACGGGGSCSKCGGGHCGSCGGGKCA